MKKAQGLFLLVVLVFVIIGVCMQSDHVAYAQTDGIRTSADGIWLYKILDDDKKQIMITGFEESKMKLLFQGAAESGIINIPSAVDEYQVYSIGDIDAGDSEKGVFQDLIGASSVDTDTVYTIEKIVISYGVVALGTNCFNNVKCEEIIIPNSVKYIGTGCFQDSEIEKVTLPDSVETIGVRAFGRCISLSEVNYGKGLKEIGSKAFMWCTSLTEINIPDSVTVLGEAVFADCTSAVSLTVGEGVKELPKTAFYGCSTLSSVTFPDGLDGIGENTFEGCIALQSVTFPESLTSIGAGAFYNCSSLEAIVLPAKVTNIGKNAFKSCSKMSELTLSESIQSIGENAFLTNYISVKDNNEADNPTWHNEKIEDAATLVITIPKELTDISTLGLIVYTDVKFNVYEDNSTVINYFTDNSVTNYITYNDSTGTNHGDGDKEDDSGESGIGTGGSGDSVAVSGGSGDSGAVSGGSGDSGAVSGGSGDSGAVSGDSGDSGAVSGDSGDSGAVSGASNSDSSSDNATVSKVEYKVGNTYTSGIYKYKLLSNNTASFMGSANKKLTTIKIPAAVQFNDKSYKITEIGKSAFKGYKKLKKITIGRNVKKIGAKAFMNCKKLTRMSIKTTKLTSVGKQAFKGVKFGAKGIDITVPKGKKDKYTKLIVRAR